MIKLMQSFTTDVPEKSIPQLQFWIDELGVFIKLAKPRKTKLGDFKIQFFRNWQGGVSRWSSSFANFGQGVSQG